MTAFETLRDGVRARPVTLTAVLSVLGYGLVVGTFAGVIDFYPDLSESTVDLLSHLIAVINTTSLVALLAGVYYISKRDIRKHGISMTIAFVLILLFLVVYMFRVGGGETKAIVAPDLVTLFYQVMLAIHIILSIVSVPVVLYVVLLGLTHTPQELANSMKATVGRIAAFAWILSLFLGIVTYVMLNHLYESEPFGALLLFGLCSLRPLSSKCAKQ